MYVFLDLLNFEAVLKERKLKNVYFAVSQTVHDGKKTVKCMLCCFVKDQNKNELEKIPQINRRMRGGGTEYQPQRSGVRRLWGRRLRGFTVIDKHMHVTMQNK